MAIASKKPTRTTTKASASLPVTSEVQILLRELTAQGLLDEIAEKNLLGGVEVPKYVETAQEYGASNEVTLVTLGADQLHVLSTHLRNLAARLTADANDYSGARQLALSQWAATNGDQTPDPSVTATWDDLAQTAETNANLLSQAADKVSQQEQLLRDKLSSAPWEGAVGVVDAAAAAATLRQGAFQQVSAVVSNLKNLKAEAIPNAAARAEIAAAQTAVADAIDPQGTSAKPLHVQMKRADIPNTPDTPLWLKIRRSSIDMGWDKYDAFINSLLFGGLTPDHAISQTAAGAGVRNSRIRLPFPDCDPYRFLKAATEVFMMVNCATFDSVWSSKLDVPRNTDDDLAYAARRLGTSFGAQQVQDAWDAYLTPSDPPDPDPTLRVLPYLALIRSKLQDQSLIQWPQGQDTTQALGAVSGILRDKLSSPCLLELIWSYWHEEGMLVQTMNAISRRFQNIRTPGDRDPLAAIEIDPLRPLNNFLWGYIQDEQHRLTVVRRAYEYDHHYGLALVGKAVPTVKGADSRTRFIEAFHSLLHLCTIFFKEDDDTTVIADGFPVLNALRDVHLILTQGAHNQYGDLPWTARQEMLMQEWLLARPEMRDFIPARIMVAYPEPWQDRVDAMKSLMGWTDTSVLHFSELGTYGERILLGARFNDWSKVIEPERAANWARFWRPEIQTYVHAYRTATGSDLSERAQAGMPSTLLRQRLAMQRVAAR